MRYMSIICSKCLSEVDIWIEGFRNNIIHWQHIHSTDNFSVHNPCEHLRPASRDSQPDNRGGGGRFLFEAAYRL